ncbi:radical SAM protein [bacterium]|nr:radical SAM protein [bacterium]
MLLELQKGIIYGPVRSRRLGSSLGINLLSTTEKVCTFNCLYCQYGWTDFTKMKNAAFPDVDEVLRSIETALTNLKSTPSYLTFSGNGEPTLHPRFAEIVEGLVKLRDKHSPDSSTAILSNSSRIHEPHIQESLAQLDLRIMKLDAGNEDMLSIYNKPCKGVNLEQIVEALVQMENVTIQALFTDGIKGNLTPKNVEEWLEKVFRIKPAMVQIYSLDRDYPSEGIKQAGRNQLLEVKKVLEEGKTSSEVY